MRKPKIKIEALQKGDEKVAKIAEKIINHQYERYEGVIRAITGCRVLYK